MNESDKVVLINYDNAVGNVFESLERLKEIMNSDAFINITKQGDVCDSGWDGIVYGDFSCFVEDLREALSEEV